MGCLNVQTSVPMNLTLMLSQNLAVPWANYWNKILPGLNDLGNRDLYFLNFVAVLYMQK